MFSDTKINYTTKDNLLIQDLLDAFNKVILKMESLEAEKCIKNTENCYPGSAYMQDRINFFNKNKLSHPTLSSIQSHVKYLIDLLYNCGPDDEQYFSQEEIDAVFNKHAITIESHYPEKFQPFHSISYNK